MIVRHDIGRKERSAMREDVNELKRILDRSRRIVFFGGAGVSTASGIPDFRSEDGLYSAYTGNISPEEILSAMYFAVHTERFYSFYRRYMVHPEAQPNAVHRYLYELEKEDRLRGVITQNIDGLHETFYPLSRILESDGVPRCSECGGIIKPWVVLYGEAPDKYTVIGACRELSGADTLIVAGTSLAVQPAASYIEYFGGKNLIVINKTPTPADEKASLVIRGDVAEVFEKLCI